MSSQQGGPRTRRSKGHHIPETSATYITFTPETLQFAASEDRQTKDIEVANSGNSTIIFKMKSTSSSLYRIRPVYFILRATERKFVKITFKGLPAAKALSQKDRVTAVMAYTVSDSSDAKLLWEKQRRDAHRPNSSSRKYIKIEFEEDRKPSMSRAPVSAPKTEISNLQTVVPLSNPRPSTKVANSGGRDTSFTHPNSTKKEKLVKPPAVHPRDLPKQPDSDPDQPLLPAPPPSRHAPVRRPPPPPPPPPPQEQTQDETEDCIPPPAQPPPPPPKSQSKSKMLPPRSLVKSVKKPPVAPSPEQKEQTSTVEDEPSNLNDVPSLPQMDIPSTNPGGTQGDEESTQQQSIVYILYPGSEKSTKAKEEDEE